MRKSHFLEIRKIQKAILIRALLFLFIIASITVIKAESGLTSLGENATIIKDAREFIKGTPDERKKLAKNLKDYKGDIAPILDALKRDDLQPRLPIPKENVLTPFALPEFGTPEFKETYPDSLAYYYYPKNFDPKKKYGLLIFFHGGGSAIPPQQARIYVHRYGVEQRLREADAQYIIMAPAYRATKTDKWLGPTADRFVSASIKEAEHRFNIDPDRIAIGGFSYGACATWHHGQRISDRLAACLIVSCGYWAVNFKGYTGLPMFIILGQYEGWVDKGGQNHTKPGPDLTDEERPPRMLEPDRDPIVHAHYELTKLGIPHVFKWHQGGHNMLNEAKAAMERFAIWLKTKKRDPYYPKVFALNPSGAFVHMKGLEPTPHKRWVTILEDTGGLAEYTWLSQKKTHGPWGPMKDETFDEFRKRYWFEIFKRKHKGCWVDAEYKSDNQFDVKTKNVKKFALWLAPEMVDFKKPIKVRVNGREMTYDHLKPNLLDALRSYLRREDWGLIYPCELIIDVPTTENTSQKK